MWAPGEGPPLSRSMTARLHPRLPCVDTPVGRVHHSLATATSLAGKIGPSLGPGLHKPGQQPNPHLDRGRSKVFGSLQYHDPRVDKSNEVERDLGTDYMSPDAHPDCIATRMRKEAAKGSSWTTSKSSRLPHPQHPTHYANNAYRNSLRTLLE